MCNQLTRESFQRVREMVKARDDETCQYCGKRDPGGEVDHVLPLSRGGNDTLENLVWACQECNRRKGDKTPREWLKQMAGYPGYGSLVPLFDMEGNLLPPEARPNTPTVTHRQLTGGDDYTEDL